MVTKTTTIYLVRHAEAEGNVKEFFQGNINTQVTAQGRKQLEYLSERFREIPLDAVVSSPFDRALETAKAVNFHHNLEIRTAYRLREINGGDWEGRAWAELPALYPAELDLWRNRMWEFCAPKGEAMHEVYSRMREMLQRIAVEYAGMTVAVVSHGCALRNFLCWVEFNDITRLHDVGWADNTAVSLVTCAVTENARRWTLEFKNDASHLPEECSTLHQSQWCRYETAKEETAT